MFPRPLLVIDTETTGFQHHEWARVVEVAAALVDEYGVEIDRFESIVRPDVFDERANDALRVNHLTPDDIYRAPSTEEVNAGFYRWLTNAGAGEVLATAYNRAFDEPMCRRMGLPVPGWTYCAMEACRVEFGRTVKLGDAARRLGVLQALPAHRALGDARTAANIVVELDKRAKARGLGCVPVGGQDRPLLGMYAPCPTPVAGWTWPSAAHAMAAMASPDPAREWPAIYQMTPRDVWEWGQRATVREDWEEIRVPWLDAVLRSKFQDPAFSLALRATGQVRLMEAAGEPAGMGTILESVREQLAQQVARRTNTERMPF